MSLCEHEVFVQEFSHKGVGRYSDVLRGIAPEPILSCFLLGGEVRLSTTTCRCFQIICFCLGSPPNDLVGSHNMQNQS